MRNPLVSVITPTYNHGRYLGRCIESLLAQAYTNWEMIIIDDGSTDNTHEIVKSYKDSRIKYFHQENQGVKFLARTINSGLARTRGELVTMFPSDDTWPPYRLEKQLPVFRETNVVLCFGRGLVIDENDKLLAEVKAPPDVSRVENRPVGSVLRSLLISNFICQTTVLIRRAALEKIGGYLQPPGLLAEDYPTHMALALLGEFRYLNLPLGNYRMHQSQMTRTHYLEMVQTDVSYVMEFFQGLSPEMRERTGWTEAGLAKELSKRLHNSYFEVGRRHLLAGDWKDARRHFGTAFMRGTFETKAKAIVGVCCSLIRIDLEELARVSGRVPLR